jgi:hypothetical protein
MRCIACRAFVGFPVIDLNSRMDKNFDDLAENLKLGVYGSVKVRCVCLF